LKKRMKSSRVNKHNKNIKGNIFSAMSSVATDYLIDIKNERHSKST